MKGLVTISIIILLSIQIQTPMSTSNLTSEETEFEYIYDQLDVNYTYNITEALSYIVFTEYNDSEIARGRSFGTKGEHKAAEILAENMSDLDLWTWNETITNLPELSEIASATWINDYKIVVKNLTSGINKTVDGFIFTPSKGPRGEREKLNHVFNFTDLKIIHKPKNTIQTFKVLKDMLNENYVFFEQGNAFNPEAEHDPIKKILNKIFCPYSDFTLFYGGAKLNLLMNIWYCLFQNCQGLVTYDFNNDTYNMGNNHFSLPVISINGTIGNEILSDINNHRIDFYLDQTSIEEVESYNVIGQLNGTCQDKIVIIDSLYDGWWCQATADSAIWMAMVLGIAKWFKDNNVTPKYTIRFIGFGGEEYGYRGAIQYQAAHKDENIIYVFDLNQLGFSQEEPELYLDFLGNNDTFLNELFEIAKNANYSNRTGYTGIRKFFMPRGAPSNDQPFARYQNNCKTICFLKGYYWILHHRDGLNHTVGDVIDYFDPDDVNVTGEIIINIIRYFCTDW
jgi:hypothetical protein